MSQFFIGLSLKPLRIQWIRYKEHPNINLKFEANSITIAYFYSNDIKIFRDMLIHFMYFSLVLEGSELF
ncbi:hypothetical protein BCV53_10460 [Parageobacillus thermoglucosidasius]|uniref:Uncharacterized protein n=1 Tax=Parageobacillus thermoglucosidasius TaxID=1426 RepID=A0AAN0YNP1_PARTM|nr:hypothetical protein AOT13_10445 [Parageobacillus thermoglucosidasius]GAJ44441.1 hypothetical protein GT2_17_00740 [Parageobacillus thermoglucosidasius NBRC 107763]ANZ30482.1 hypothetical protein BCV53_10460 [Parageobacillus thermoglucosidasius]APM81220.1 hypothetical protein BCV54_10470 [Parageobacillus thermoglucosidasius]KJX68625.1 hypothetical protein WH82_11545 [Parageobacillus thermoglucosidasius]